MRHVLVVGSVALDSVTTPAGSLKRALGGSAVYFSMAARFFAPVRLIGVVGRDFPGEYLELLQQRRINTEGLKIAEGSTFHWSGRYEGDLNQAVTLDTQLNVFARFDPVLTPADRSSRCVFLANIDPGLQLRVLKEIERPDWIACDTMNYWIQNKREDLLDLLSKVDISFINETELKELSGSHNLLKAARWLIGRGIRVVVVKKGEHGVLCVSEKGVFSLPAFPLEDVKDPTGAGDSFAGGFLGFLSQKRNWHIHLKSACVYGAILASFNVENFSVERLKNITLKDIEKRFRCYQEMLKFRE